MHRTTNSRFQISDTVGAEIRQLAVFDVIPQPFIGIQIRSISRKKLDLQPTPRLTKELLERLRAVDQGPVPENDDSVSEVPPQVFEKTKNFSGADTAVDEHQIQTAPPADRRDGRKLGPRRAVSQNRGFALRGPRSNAGRMQ